MRKARFILATILAFTVAGCAAKPKPAPSTRPASTQGFATRPIDPKALLTLDQLEPKLDPPKSQPSTDPAATATAPAVAPLDAIELFAAARDAFLLGKRQSAVELLEKAAALDPQSFEIRHALGKAYLNGTWEERSLAALKQAAEIDPDRVELQTDIGRQLIAKGDWEAGVRHLRLALLASDAETDASNTAVAELHLAKALEDKGYDTAAVQLLDRVRRRVEAPTLDVRMNAELYFYVTRPEFLALRAGQLYERLGKFEEALANYLPMTEAEPTNFEWRSRVVRTIANTGRFDDAAAAAADAVVRFRASPESLRLLREVYTAIGRDGQAADQLRKLHEQKPDDRSILYALADLLSADDARAGEAVAVLERAAARNPDDFEIVRRLVVLGQELHPDNGAAAAVRLIRWSADHPDSIHVMAGLWTELIRPRPEGRVRPAAIESLNLGPAPSPQLLAARLFWVSRVAQASMRREIARDALARAVAIETKPFPPAYRGQLDAVWSRNDFSRDEKVKRSEDLAGRAATLGDGALAAELRGLSLLNQDDTGKSLDAFDEAVRLGGTSPDLQLVRALAARKTGDVARFEQLLWKLVGDWPQYDDGFDALYGHYVAAGAGPQADKVLALWQESDSQSLTYRLRRVRRFFASGNSSGAEKLLLETLDDAPGDAQVNRYLYQLFSETNRLEALADRYRAKLADVPCDLAIVSNLVDVETERGKKKEAAAAVDSARQALGDQDADALYQLAHLYVGVGRTDAAEQALRDALRAEPDHGPAGNDLGYSMADRGENLPEAERLIRLATAAQPDNAAFFDSLGWVLYKRGRFAEAQETLERAVTYSPRPDPVMLDHLGDALYRQGKQSDAADRWRAAAERIAELFKGGNERDDLKTLQADLERKRRALAAGESVKVAPVVEDPAAAAATVPSQAQKRE